jgi:hypothetical protein
MDDGRATTMDQQPFTGHDSKCVACLGASPVWKLCDTCYQLVQRWRQRNDG